MSSWAPLALLGVLLAVAQPAAAATPTATPPWVIFRFHAGAPLPGAPGVAPNGTVYVASAEGYVHALDAEGSFKWSYTVEGAIVGGPSVDADGRVYVATTSRRIYALSPNGRRYWLFNCPVRPETGVVRGTDGTLYFVGSDQHLWAISSRAGAMFRVGLSGKATAGPEAGPSGQVAVAVGSGEVSVVQTAARRFDVSVGDAPATALVWLGESAFGALAGGRLFSFHPPSKTPAWAPISASHAARARADELVLALEDGRLVTVSSRDGREIARRPSVGKLSAPPVVAKDGTIVTPGEDGTLRAVLPDGGVLSLRVASAALLEPVLFGSRIVASGGDGTVVVVDAESWRRGGL